MNNFEGEIEKVYWTTDEIAGMIKVSVSTVTCWNHTFKVGAMRGLYTKEMVAKMHTIHNLRMVEMYSTKGVKRKLEQL